MRPCTGSTTTDPPDTSLPVPDVVGTAIRSTDGTATAASPVRKSSIGRPWPTTSLAALARSMAEPPPTATSTSGRSAATRAAASATSAGVGSPGGFWYSGRPATAAATASIASTGGSDTTSARRPPITSASAPMTPGPNLIRTGSWA